MSHIIDSVNVIKQFEDLTMIQEEQGEFHMKEHDIAVVKNQLSKSIEELKESTIEVVVRRVNELSTY